MLKHPEYNQRSLLHLRKTHLPNGKDKHRFYNNAFSSETIYAEFKQIFL